MARRFQCINPSDARIFIDFDNKKNPVTFEYPAKESPFKIVHITFRRLWSRILILTLFFISIFMGGIMGYYLIKDHNAQVIEVTIQNQTMNLSIIKNESGILQISPVNWSQDDTKIMIIMTLAFPLILLLFFLPPIISAYICCRMKSVLKAMPNLNMWLSKISNRGYYYKRVRNLKNRIFEIPMMDNVFMDYKLTKDFKKQIRRIEILEHDYFFQKITLSGKKKKHTKQTDAWTARFIFEEIPQTGYLEIKYI